VKKPSFALAHHDVKNRREVSRVVPITASLSQSGSPRKAAKGRTSCKRADVFASGSKKKVDVAFPLTPPCTVGRDVDGEGDGQERPAKKVWNEDMNK
jgi:hypothetical protein